MPIAQERSASQRTLRIAGEYRDGLIPLTQVLNQFANERTLTNAGTTRESNDPARFSGRGKCLEHVCQVFTRGGKSDQTCQRLAIPTAEAF